MIYIIEYIYTGNMFGIEHDNYCVKKTCGKIKIKCNFYKLDASYPI